MTVNVTSANSTDVAKKSSKKPSTAQEPIPNVGSTNDPYASTMVRLNTMKAQNVNACASPGTVQASSLRWPITSVACAWGP